ncbi:hypothetical protein HOLleu_23606 [Holothuria leucospilota]|uniref:Uncharacterized protein n=1 Tax=Holothuria leucospilota TaxID=206669 RepID=A0A9Q1BVF3_HOLLE|nr:hypothetical protein HOLleu_23606 [Holothuria leucospilota]
MEQLRAPNPLSFEGNLSTNWKKWIERFDLYLVASGVYKKDAKLQSYLFLHVIGEQGLDVYNSFKFDNEIDRHNVTALKAKFEAYCAPRKNITYERHKFSSRVQQEGETIDQYVTDLRNLSTTCEFGDLKDSLIGDKIVCGLRSDSLRERMLREEDLTLEKAINTCRAAESSKSQAKTLTGPVSQKKWGNSAKPSRSKYRPKGTRPNNESENPKSLGPTQRGGNLKQKQFNCKKCGTIHYPGECPAYGEICHCCQKKGHFSRCCFRNPERKIGAVGAQCDAKQYESMTEDEESTGLFLDKIYMNSINNTLVEDDWMADIKLGKRKVCFKLDMGAQANLLPLTVFRQIAKRQSLHKVHVNLSTYTGEKIPVLGSCTMRSHHQGKNLNFRFLVVNVRAKPILGAEACEKLGLIHRVWNVTSNSKETTSELFEEYHDVFTSLGCLAEEHHIKVDPGVKPVIYPPRKVSVGLRDRLKQELDKMEQNKIIQKVNSPIEWVNSLVIIEKPNGDLRICLDPKDHNAAIKREHFQLPSVDEITSNLAGAKFYTVLDANQGFWQMGDSVNKGVSRFGVPLY